MQYFRLFYFFVTEEKNRLKMQYLRGFDGIKTENSILSSPALKTRMVSGFFQSHDKFHDKKFQNYENRDSFSFDIDLCFDSSMDFL